MMDSRNIIENVLTNSIAEDLDISVGDELVSINGQEIKDVIDYMYHMADDYVEVLIKSLDGDLVLYEIDKDPGEHLGIEFSNSLMDQAKTCSNKCIFCFIDQMPSGMRESLYFKDDDSRLSFLQGNYITLTNLSENDIQRIIDYRLSPINVSVHSTNPDLRIDMMKNNRAGNLYDILKRFDQAGLEINCQIVLVPDINDKEELTRSLMDLFKLENSVQSVAIVPVGITKYRENLPKLSIFDKDMAAQVIRQVEDLQKYFLQERSTRFAYLSDEFYMQAQIAVPKEDAYEGYPQIENGVGLVRNFYEEVKEVLDSRPIDQRSGEATIVTGTLAYDFMKNIRDMVVEKFPNLDLNVKYILNDFFGHTITVAGLVTGSDIIKQMKSYDTKHILIPDVMLRQGTDYFLDDVTISDIEVSLGLTVTSALVEGEDFIEIISGEVL